MQGDSPCLWAEVESDAMTQEYQFAIVGTGHPAPPGGQYVDTWQQGGYVWHLYSEENFS